jgi:IS30 family transposase
MKRSGFEHFQDFERERIAIGLGRGESLRAIGRVLGRAPSSIGREVRRNRTACGYVAVTAQRLADRRRLGGGPTRKLAPPVAGVDNPLRSFVLAKFRRRWSPEQIASELRKLHPEQPERRVSHQTIYNEIAILARGVLKKEVNAYLRQKGRPRQQGTPSGCEWIHQLVHERPDEVEDRLVPGHFEGDLLIGKAKSPAAVGVLLERMSRKVWLTKLERRDAYSAYRAFEKKLKGIARHLRKSLTYDQGSEMAEHERLTRKLDIEVYFCDPRSPWQRAGCENTNGLLRDYLPKGMDMAELTQVELDKIAFQLNERPRKTLGWNTPNETWKHINQRTINLQNRCN